MKFHFFRIMMIGLVCWSNLQDSFSQFVDITNPKPYLKVFVQTDEFDQEYLKVLEQNYTKVKQDTIGFSMLNDLAYYWHTRNLGRAMEFTKVGLAKTGQVKDSLWYGRFMITQGSILLRQEELDSAEVVLLKASKMVTESDLPFLYTQLGYVFERRGKLETAADYAKKSLELGLKLSDLKAQAMAYSDLSNLFWKQSKPDNGIEFGLKSLALFEKRGIDDLDYDFTLYVVGNNYLLKGEYGKALTYFEKSIEIGERYGFYNNLSDVYISLTDLYTYLNIFEKAEIAGLNAIKYADLLDNNFMMMRSYLSLGKLQNKMGNYEDSILSLKSSINIATINFGDEFYLNQAYKYLAEGFSQKGEYENAFAALKKHVVLKDSIFTAEGDRRISELQTEYDVALKEEIIQLQEVKIAQQKSQQILILVVGGSLLLLLGVLFMAFHNNRKKNRLLEKQNKEKEFLLKEIHHRVKNNLEIVSSLLLLQSAKLDDEMAVNAMQESQNRVQSMSMIHQRLYQGENLASIEMKDYFINLGSHVLDTFGASKRVNLKCAMDNLNLDVDTAVPLGLIVNELLTNAIKHAFPYNQKGKVEIFLEQKESNKLQLKVVDNGIGKKDFVRGTGFGTQLINLLVQQLDGTLKYTVKNGTKVTIQFRQGKAA